MPSKKQKRMAPKEYVTHLAQKGAVCPFCRGNNTHIGPLELDSRTRVSSDVVCLDCREGWSETFGLSAYIWIGE